MSENSIEYEPHIILSSDTNNSPDTERGYSTFLKNSEKTKSLTLSDTELEEGEIEDDEDEKVSVQDSCIVEQSEKSNTGDNNPVKRKFSDHHSFETSKKLKSDGCSEEKYRENISPEEYAWSNLRILLIGDERVVSLNWEINTDFPGQDFYHIPNCNLDTLCSLVEKHIYKKYDVVLLLSFHYDFVCLGKNIGKNSENGNVNYTMDLKSDININEILNKVRKYNNKWTKEYPNTYIIWTVPSPPDFYKYNSFILKEGGLDPELLLDKKVQYELSKDYFALTRKFTKEWKLKNADIPLFPLSKVLFMKKQCYKRSFMDKGPPKFPRGLLMRGMYPTLMMCVYCAYLLIEYFIEKQFFPEIQFGLDLRLIEQKLIEIDPEVIDHIHSSDKYSHQRRHRKHSRHRSHRRYHKHDATSSHSSRSRSRSKSETRRHKSVSLSKHQSKLISKSSHRHHSKSRSGSESTSLIRNHVPHSRKRSRSKSKSHIKNPNLRSTSLSDSESSEKSSCDTFISKSSLKQAEKSCVENMKLTNAIDEVSFFKTLTYLREVHEIQCALYRRKPQTHPQYKNEKERFLKTYRSKYPFDVYLSKWDEYWKKRLEEIFEETWKSKKDQLTKDLNEKGAFTALNNFCDDKSQNNSSESKRNNCKITENAISNFIYEERMKFKKENAETVKNYLEEFDNAIESSQTSQENAEIVGKSVCQSEDFTLADVFKDESDARNEPEKNKVDGPCSDTGGELKIDDICSEDASSPMNANGDDVSIDSDIDLDLDGLMENTEFLQGLDEIDKELQNTVPDESKETTLETKNDLKSNHKDDLASIFTCDDEVTANPVPVSKDNLKSEFINVLQMLFRVSKRLGPLGLSVSALYHRALEDLKLETFPSLNSDSKSLLLLICNKLNVLLKEELPQVQKAIFGEISERLNGFLRKLDIQNDNRFAKVNIRNIATATVGQEVPQVVSFIRNTLLYHGYTQFTSEDVMNIYISVKASQEEMKKS